MLDHGQAHPGPLGGQRDLGLGGQAEQLVQLALGQGAPLTQQDDGLTGALEQTQQQRPLGGVFGRVGQKAQQGQGQQLRVAGGQEGGGACPVGQGHAPLAEQGAGLFRQAAAQGGQGHDHGVKVDLPPLGPVEILHVSV